MPFDSIPLSNHITTYGVLNHYPQYGGNSPLPQSRVIIVVVACILILAMDAATGILGINAEAAQNKVNDMNVWVFECKKPSKDAFNLAVAATIVLGVAHIIANLIGLHDCCKPTSDVFNSACLKLSKASLILLWIEVAGALVLLGIGIIANIKSRSSCSLGHHKFLAYGGIACFVHTPFAVVYIAITNATTCCR